MDFLSQLQALLAAIQSSTALIQDLQAKLADAEASAAAIAQKAKDEGLAEGKALGLVEGEKLGYDKGYAEGFEAGKLTVGDKLYSQVELDAKVAEAVAPLKAELELSAKQLAELVLKLEELTLAVDTAKAEGKKVGVAEERKRNLELIRAQKALEDESEVALDKAIEALEAPIVEEPVVDVPVVEEPKE